MSTLNYRIAADSLHGGKARSGDGTRHRMDRSVTRVNEEAGCSPAGLSDPI